MPNRRFGGAGHSNRVEQASPDAYSHRPAAIFLDNFTPRPSPVIVVGPAPGMSKTFRGFTSMLPLTNPDATRLARARPDQASVSEEEAEWLAYESTGGKVGPPLEAEVIFGSLGLGSAIAVAIFGWVVFKKVWFGWAGMPGWW